MGLGRRALLVPLALLLVAAGLVACASSPLLTAVSVSPAVITPDGDRVDDVATIAYSVTRPSTVSIFIQGADGQRYTLRDGLERPPGAYEATFDGAVATDEDGQARQVLPAGEYTFVVEVTGASGEQARREGTITIANPDRTQPVVENVAAHPTEISPYDPQLRPETRISYRLTKQATVTFYAIDPDGQRSRLSEPELVEAGEHSFTWDGLVRNKVPPEGDTTIVVEARDTAGNATAGQTTVKVSGTEEPDAVIVRTRFTPHAVMKGDVVKVEITVRNTGSVPLRTHGPEPGYTYTTLDTFASVENGRYADVDRLWRVGVDWAGGLGAEGARYPYRWGLGKDLAPGEETTVVGYIQILEDYPELRFYAGLIHEKVRYQVDKVGQQLIQVSH